MVTCVRVRELVRELPDVRERLTDDISDDDPLLELGIIDSFDLIELILKLENEFSVSIDPESLTEENFGTIQQITSLIESITTTV